MPLPPDKAPAAPSDTERLDWLEQRKYLCYGITHDALTGKWVRQIETGGYAEQGKTLREAIDKAMQLPSRKTTDE
jgi:hypothetical protein